MRSFIYIPLAFVISVAAHTLQAQEPQKAYMEVRGLGEAKVQPDLVQVQIHLEAREMAYDNTLRALDKKTKSLLSVLRKAGLDEEQARVRNFSVYPNYVYRDGRQYDSGFVARQNIEVEFPNTRKRIDDFYEAFSKSAVDVPMDFTFALSDPKKAEIRNVLIDKAVADARAKAERLARASGVRLMTVYRIHYGQGASFPGPVPLRMEMTQDFAGARKASVSEMEAAEIEMTDEVQMIWLIE